MSFITGVRDLDIFICSKMSPKTIVALSATCKYYLEICRTNQVWQRHIDRLSAVCGNSIRELIYEEATKRAKTELWGIFVEHLIPHPRLCTSGGPYIHKLRFNAAVMAMLYPREIETFEVSRHFFLVCDIMLTSGIPIYIYQFDDFAMYVQLDPEDSFTDITGAYDYFCACVNEVEPLSENPLNKFLT